jgi:hypothetical protein
MGAEVAMIIPVAMELSWPVGFSRLQLIPANDQLSTIGC